MNGWYHKLLAWQTGTWHMIRIQWASTAIVVAKSYSSHRLSRVFGTQGPHNRLAVSPPRPSRKRPRPETPGSEGDFGFKAHHMQDPAQERMLDRAVWPRWLTLARSLQYGVTGYWSLYTASSLACSEERLIEWMA